MEKTQKQLLQILDCFPLEGKVLSVEPFGNGHINDTLKVTTEGDAPRYVLQRINHAIFKDVDMLQRNIHTVTSHIRHKLEEVGETDIDRKTLTFLPAADGKLYHFDGENYWRVSVLIPRSKSYEEVSPEKACAAGGAFGRFQTMLADLPEGALGETIPHFHNMEFRLKQFHEAVEEDAARRSANVRELIVAVEERAEAMCIQERLFREGKLKKRVNHCDTKVNNILFDEGGDVLCVIDLDTVMPGFVLSDFGDFIRTGANTGAEDDADLSRIGINMDVFKAYAHGYLETATFLTPTETSLLPYGARLLTYMQTVRFLTDYINGDTYYKIHYPEHNLVRTRAQFQLLLSLEEHAETMNAEINRIKEKLRTGVNGTEFQGEVPGGIEPPLTVLQTGA